MENGNGKRKRKRRTPGTPGGGTKGEAMPDNELKILVRYHADIPQDITYNTRARMCMLLEEWGVKVKYHHQDIFIL